MDIKLAAATTRILDTLCEIEKKCFEQEAFTKQQLEYLITDYSTIGLTAIVNGEIAGFAIARVNIRRNMTFGHILTVDVAPAYQRKGIAKKMLLQIETILRERGIKECRLEDRENNVAGLNHYKKLGYTEIVKLEKYYGSAHGLYLKKSL